MDKKALKKEVEASAKKAQQLAEKELKQMQKVLNDAGKKAESYIKKNPGKAAAISAGVGAAVGAALALLLRGGKKK